MLGTLYKHSCKGHQRNLFPDGLRELMADITREVLRARPGHTSAFIADYLNALLITREHTRIASSLIDDIIDISLSITEMLKILGMAHATAEKAAYIIQNAFRDYLEKVRNSQLVAMPKFNERDCLHKIVEVCDLDNQSMEKVQKILESSFKSFFYRQKTYQEKIRRIPGVSWKDSVERTLLIYQKCVPKKEDMNRAAIVIQCAVRSYQSRKHRKEFQVLNECATKIQSAFRGFIVRKRILQKVMGDEYDSCGLLSAKAALKYLNPTEAQVQAAQIIQAVFRGFKVRREIVQINEAATMVQSLFRGFLVRKQIQIANEKATIIQKAFRSHLKAIGVEITQKPTSPERTDLPIGTPQQGVSKTASVQKSVHSTGTQGQAQGMSKTTSVEKSEHSAVIEGQNVSKTASVQKSQVSSGTHDQDVPQPTSAPSVAQVSEHSQNQINDAQSNANADQLSTHSQVPQTEEQQQEDPESQRNTASPVSNVSRNTNVNEDGDVAGDTDGQETYYSDYYSDY